MRHPPANNQRAAAYFLARGHHESLLRSLVKSNKKKREALMRSVETYLPGWKMSRNYGGSSIWVKGPRDLDARKLAEACQKEGVLIEPGSVHYISEDRPYNNFRLGYTSIPLDRIDAGVQLIAEIERNLSS
jgi:GntR family transcriptional regulator/MocR family aminotransferase